MQLNLYKPNILEEWMNLHYQKNGIHYASDSEIEHVASIFNTNVITTKGPSFVKWDDDFCIIFINAYLNKQKNAKSFSMNYPIPSNTQAPRTIYLNCLWGCLYTLL